MSETVKVGRNRPPQNGWASKEEVAELRAEVAELRETNQAMLEEIKGLRAELGGAKRHRLLGAVATSAAAFFGKFFHRGKDLGDFHEEKSSKGANRGAHAKGKEEEKEKEKEKEKGGTPIASARRGEKSKNSREQEDKPNKNKASGIGKKIVAGALALALVAGSAVAAFGPHKNAQDLPKGPSVTEVGAGDLRMPETEQALAEQAVEAAEAAHQQQLAETMGMSVEDMHAVADRHGVNHNDIGTAKAHDQMRDNMESDYNLSEKINLDNMSEAERSERSKQEILFANMNNKYVTAQISSARLGAHDASDSELTQQLFKQYEENDVTWQEQAKENAKFLKASTYSTRLARTSKTHTYGTERQWDGPIEDQYVLENSGGETVYIIEVANGDIKIQFKDGCIQAVWVEEVAQPRQQVKERTVVQQEVVRQEEEHHQKERQSRQYSWNRRNDEEEHRQNDSKDPKANDTQQNADKNFEANAKANDDAPTYGGQKNPDASAKSGNTNKNPDDGSEVVPDDNNGSIGGRQDAKPGQQDWGDGGGAADSGQDKTAVNPGDQGGSGKGTTGGNQTDSGGGGKETDRRSSSQHRSSHSEEGGTETTDENGKTIRTSYKNASSTGWVNDDDTHSGSNQADGDVELQNIVVPGA